MLTGFFNWLLAAFVIEPFQAELAEKLAASRAPVAIVRQVQDCAIEAAPVLAGRAARDPWWGVSTAIGVALGLTDMHAVVAEATPGCRAAVAAVQPFTAARG